MTEIKPYMCSCCNDIWSRENQKSIKLGKYELHLCPDCYHEYIISNNKVLDKIRNEFIDRYPRNYANELELGGRSCVFSLNEVLWIIDKYKVEIEK